MYETGYCEAQAITNFFIVILVLFIFLAVVMAIFKSTKSKRYRKLLTDLYVAGKIRQISDKDNVSLAKEFKDFRSVVKKWKMEEEPLDNTIERELQEKVEEDKEDILKS